MKLYALIMAGGLGSRMNAEIPKQFLLLNNKPILMHTIERFANFGTAIEIVLVLPENQFGYWENLCEEYGFVVPHTLVAGGQIRFESVKNGLAALPDDGIVAIHDGVRPLVSRQTLARCFETANAKGNALPVVPVIESLRQIDNNTNTAADRSKFVTVQTPQVFKLREIKEAYQQPFNPLFTDDASVMERIGITIELVEGNIENVKITTPTDLCVAEVLLERVK